MYAVYMLENQQYGCLAYSFISSWFVFLFTLKLDSTINFPSNLILFLFYFVNPVANSEVTKLEFLIWLLPIFRQKCT